MSKSVEMILKGIVIAVPLFGFLITLFVLADRSNSKYFLPEQQVTGLSLDNDSLEKIRMERYLINCKIEE